MARLPKARPAIIESKRSLVISWQAASRRGGAKAVFFNRFGFNAVAWHSLRDALLDHARSARVVSVSEPEFGKKYILEGRLPAPDGRKPRIRAIWVVAAGETAPRLVTAYPEPAEFKR
jgi:hypothetical protein